VLHFSLAELLDMEFDELVQTWFPVAAAIARVNGEQLTGNVARIFGGQ
jgi:hypothetical protein